MKVYLTKSYPILFKLSYFWIRYLVEIFQTQSFNQIGQLFTKAPKMIAENYDTFFASQLFLKVSLSLEDPRSVEKIIY